MLGVNIQPVQQPIPLPTFIGATDFKEMEMLGVSLQSYSSTKRQPFGKSLCPAVTATMLSSA
ncbi:hypothetical protein Vi05172_g2976 [Venturia inaequalis]|nr:hypothetical protein Vi05172_g2976 [Venturia inaequalis]